MSVLAWLVHLLLIFSVLHFTARRYVDQKIVFWAAAAVKLFAGFCVGWIYLYYYEAGDTLTYFQDASRLADLARENTAAYVRAVFLGIIPADINIVYQVPRAFFLTRLISLFSLVTAENYWISGLWFSLISFLASWRLVTVISGRIPSARLAAITAFLFFPSVVFWTSGLLKESLAMAAFFFLISVILKWWTDAGINKREWVVAVLAGWLFWNLKYYYFAGFLPVVLALIFYRYLVASRWKLPAAWELAVYIILLIVPLAMVSFLHPNFDISRILGVIVENHNAYLALSEPGEVVVFRNLKAEWSSVLSNAPWALFSGLFRPLPWEAQSLLQFVASMENALLLLLFLASLMCVKRYLSSPHRMLILSAGAAVVILAVFITLSAPNFGTLSRYRTGYVALLLFLILCANPALEYLQRRLRRLGSQ